MAAAKRVDLHPEAIRDIANAFDWYEERQAGLGTEFVRAVDACLADVQDNPTMYAMAHENYRRAVVRRFPYLVFFELVEDVVTVFAVFHSFLDPGKWRRRLS